MTDHLHDVVILTDARYARPDPTDWYQAQILREEVLLGDALRALGLRTTRVAWSDTTMDWSRTRTAVFRSTWDYFDRFAEFSAWVTAVDRQTRLINSGDLIRWNWDKHYLLDLARRGIAIPATRMIETGCTQSLAHEFASCGWDEVILKPAISGGARHTYRLTARDLATHEAVFARLIGSEAMMLQQFQSSVLRTGEVSLMVIAGRCTHAVRKRAKAGDFRVQDDHGGTVEPYQATASEIAFAEQAVAACPQQPLYARVDLVGGADGAPLLMELELLEPELFLRFHPPAASRMAEAIAHEVNALSK